MRDIGQGVIHPEEGVAEIGIEEVGVVEEMLDLVEVGQRVGIDDAEEVVDQVVQEEGLRHLLQAQDHPREAQEAHLRQVDHRQRQALITRINPRLIKK